MMLVVKRFILSASIVLSLIFSTQVSAVMIDLTSFSSNAPGSVAISNDGLSATFYEDATITSPVALWNTGLAIGSESQALSFDYELTVASNNADYFDFYLGNLTSPLFSIGGNADATGPLLFVGSYSTDVSSYANSTLPLVFSFIYDWPDMGLDSTLMISNLELIEIAVHEPATLFLIMLGLFAIAVFIPRRSA